MSVRHPSPTRRRAAHRPRVSGALVDATLAVLAGSVALLPWMTSFDSLRYLVVGITAVVAGVGLTWVAARLGLALAALPMAAAGYLIGGAILIAGPGLPTAGEVGQAARVVVSGWKRLLTTAPPIDSTQALIALPLLAGLTVGTAAMLLRGWPDPWAPTLPAVLLGVLTTLTGAGEAWRPEITGLALAGLTVVWAALRRRRVMRVTGTGAGRRQQLILAVALLGVAGLIGWGLGPLLPGVDTRSRVALRDVVTPPFDVRAQPSPLVGFHKYGEDRQELWNAPLLTARGLPAGARLRFAVLDSYSGTTWGAGTGTRGDGNVFAKVGREIRDDSPAPTGPREFTLEVEQAYARAPELRTWVPSVGPWSRVSFRGPRAQQLRNSLRYNAVTGQGVVAHPLAGGDVIGLTASVVRERRGALSPGPAPVLDAAATAFVTSIAGTWAGSTGSTWERVSAVAEQLRDGAYTDGDEDFPSRPGNSQGRLESFLDADVPLAGNDEQYAATFALMANNLGMPARVVLGAVLPEGGVIRGKHVRAWVEMQGESGEWFAVPNEEFMPDRDKPPSPDERQATAEIARLEVPPAPGRQPPGSLDGLTDVDPGDIRAKTDAGRTPPEPAAAPLLPSWADPVLRVAGPPVGLVGLVALGIGGGRGLRRWRRRNTGPQNDRLAAAWHDLVDHVRDLGVRVDPRATRLEQAAGFVGHAELAVIADRAVFGPGRPAPGEIDGFWRAVRAAKHAATRQASWQRRLLRPWSIRSLLPNDRTPRTAPGSRPRRTDRSGIPT